ncbi:copper resistance protein CopC [Actinoplanes sp. KI2]|uniref:copper resistance CopC/CopD family protein n=1 Tax=Actinoplanes sp. KI2 TaxID=2983315 RepID=UPI0021D5D435|nr:copper resistance CopC family protein [Actinoplanes sp. KI2]MCU7727769.1 copper resistance protein CopC [Actinoplanes sp. KI2]
MRGTRWAAIGCGVAAGVLLALGAPAGPAAAHADLLRTDPPAGTVVGGLPAAVTLFFSEPVQPVAAQIRVIAPDGGRADGERVSERATATVRVPLRAGGPTGTYALSYRVVSDDGHPMVGVLTFSVGAPSAVPPIPVAADAPAVAAPLVLAMGAAHLAAVAGLALLAGPVLFLWRLWPAGVARRGARRLARIGLVAVAAGTVAELCLQVPYGAGSGPVTGDAVRQALVSPYGLAHLARLGVLAAIAAPLGRMIAGRGRRAPVGTLAVLVLAVLGLATWPLAGHPRTSALPALTVVADAAHLGALGLWLGGLVTLLAFVLPRASTAELSRVLPAWSRWAQWAVVVLVAAGSAEAVVQVRGFGRLVDTSYGRLVLVKIAVLAVVLAVAGHSRRLVVRRFAAVELDDRSPAPALVAAAAGGGGPPPVDRPAGSRAQAAPPSARRRLRRAVLAETAGIGVVLAVAMALVQTAPPPAGATPVDPGAGRGVVGGLSHMGMLVGSTAMVRVRFSPAVTGINHVQVYAYGRAGAPLTVLGWAGTAELPGRAPLGIPLIRVSGNHATAVLAVPWPGTWRLRFTITLPAAQSAVVTGTVTVRPG